MRALRRRYGHAPAGAAQAAIGKLYAWAPKLEETLAEVRAGKLSYSSDQPLRVSKLDTPRGGYFILDGHHRAIEALMAGKRTVPIVIDEYVSRIERAGGAHRGVLENKMRVQAFFQESHHAN